MAELMSRGPHAGGKMDSVAVPSSEKRDVKGGQEKMCLGLFGMGFRK